MSETVRNYSFGRPRKAARRKVDLRVPGGLLALLILFALPFVFYFLWISRDSRSVEEFIVTGRGFELVIRDPLATRGRMADSFLWSVLPDDHPLTALPGGLRTPVNLPEWMTRNLSGAYWYVAADVDAELDNVLLVTRVSRVGVGVELMQRFKPSVARVPAGGLDIYYYAPHSVYYALRGRVLVASPSRRTLITALTLSPEERATADALAGLFAAGPEDMKGRYVCTDGEPLYDYFQSFSFALDTNSNEITLKLLGATQPDLEARLAPVVSETTVTDLPMPPTGPVRIAANLGRSLRDSWSAIDRIFETPWIDGAEWAAWQSSEPGTYGHALTTVLGDTGPAFALAWRGFDLDEMIPAPIVVGLAETSPDQRDASPLALISEDAASNDCPLPTAYANGSDGRIHVPAISGPALEAVIDRGAAWTRFASSQPIADEFFAGSPATETPGPGHVYVELHPNEIIDRLQESGAFLARNGMLRDHTVETWSSMIASWRERWSAAKTIQTRVTASPGRVQATLTIRLAPPTPVEEP